MDVNLLIIGTVVPAAPCVFYATAHQIYWRFDTDDMVFTRLTYRTYRDQHTDLHLENVIIVTCYVHTTATYITLNE